MPFRRASAGPLAAMALAVFATPVASQAPSLPRLDLDALPAAARSALADAYEAATARPSDGARVGELARRLHAWEQWDAAAQAYARSAALDGRFDWYYLEGVVQARRGRHDEAARAFEAAIQRQPDFLPARLRLADALFESGQVEQAGELYEALSEEPSAAPHARYGLGRVRAAQGDHAAAVHELETAVSLYPEFGSAWYALGLSARRLGDRARATDALERARKYGALWPGVDDPLLSAVRGLRDDAAARLERGLTLDRQGDLPGATREHEAAVEANPDLAQAHVNLISLYGRQQEWDKAEAHYREALRLGSGLAEAHYNYGILLLLQDRSAEASDAFKEAVEANPQYAAAWTNLGQLAERAGRPGEALAHYRRAVQHAPTEPAARFHLGRMLIATGQPREAVPHFQALAETDGPDRPRYVYGLATAWVLAGDLVKGRQYANEARALAAARGQADLVAAIDRDLAKLQP